MSNLRRYGYDRSSDAFDNLFRGFFVRPVESGAGQESPAVRVDVKENDQSYSVQAELPGVKKEDIHVDVDGAVVSISAERKQENEVKEGGRVLRTERYFGKVSRSFQLAQEIDDSQIVAKYHDGVLELTLPKKAAVQAKRVTIQ